MIGVSTAQNSDIQLKEKEKGELWVMTGFK